MASKIATTVASQARRGSAEALTLAGRCGGLDRVEHSMARDPVVEGGTEARSLAVVAGETRVRLGDVVGRAEFLLRPPIVLRHRKGLERRLGAGAATYLQLEDLGLAAGRGELEIAFGAVDLPEQVRAARDAAAI